VYLRVASTVGAGRLIRHCRVPAQGAFLPVLLAGCLALSACERQAPAADQVSVELSLRPIPPVVGIPAVGEMTLRDSERRLVRGVTVRAVAHMSHPGMAPIIADVEERHDGAHDVRLQFTMAGDWIVHVTGTRPDGQPLDQWLDVKGVRSAE
jgi:hypothetical protein